MQIMTFKSVKPGEFFKMEGDLGWHVKVIRDGAFRALNVDLGVIVDVDDNKAVRVERIVSIK